MQRLRKVSILAVAAVTSVLLVYKLGSISKTQANAMDLSTTSEARLQFDLQKKLLATAQGLTSAQMITDLLRYGGAVPDFESWMRRAVGVLQGEPEAAAMLVEPFDQSDMSGKQFILDLLASTGTPKAQAVMRSLLNREDLRADDKFPLLVQRFSLVQTPAPENAQYLLEASRTERALRPSHANASLVSLGSTIGHLHASIKAPYVSTAGQYNRILREELASARADDTMRAAIVLALGNTKLAENLGVIAEHANDSSTQVRSSVAEALRSFNDDSSFGALLALINDRQSVVSLAAAHSLDARSMSGNQLDELLVQIVENRTDGSVDALLVNMLARNRSPNLLWPKALELMFRRNEADPRTRNTIQLLLNTWNPA